MIIVTTNTILIIRTKITNNGSRILYPLEPRRIAEVTPRITAHKGVESPEMDCSPSAAPEIFPAS
jgi:hypothetical protein